MASHKDAGDNNYYEVLEVTKQASASDIKRSYQRLIKQCHPDKIPPSASQSERDTITQQFHNISQAYAILSDHNKRLEYDTKLNAHAITQSWPVSAEVDLDEMTFDPTSEGYQMPCRCGGQHMVSETELEEGVDLVCCSTCSLTIKLLYQER